MTAVPAPADALGRRRPVDIGRLLLTPVCAVLLVINALRLLSPDTYRDKSLPVALALGVGTVLTSLFYVLMVRGCLTRLPARATSRSMRANTAAVVATWLPFGIGFVGSSNAKSGLLVVADVVLLVGLSWSVWSLRTLGRSFSVIPQARSVVSTGPYALVRHPLYLGEMTATLGVAMLRPSPATFAGWALLCALQVYRAGHEERTLASALPDYHSYARRTRRLVPGLY